MKLGIGVFAGLILLSLFSTCKPKNKEVSTEVIAREYAKGLDLQAVTNLARSSKTPKELEEKLNSSSIGVNNIDLNDDDVVDYINVTEYGDGSDRGFSLSTEISPGNVQEIATIQFSQSAEKVAVQTTGHSSLYGSNHYYRSSFGLSDALLWGYVLSSHNSYRSPYGYGNYPGSYGRGWSRHSNANYANRNSRYRSMSPAMPASTPSIKSSATSPNANKQAARAKMVSNPKQSQRSFAKRTGTTRSSGGFGRSSSSSSRSSSSRSSFGGGK
jgi:hypothetical protein